MSTKTKFCSSCSHSNHIHDFQDKTYGKFTRVFNVDDKTGTEVCTVCGSGKKGKK